MVEMAEDLLDSQSGETSFLRQPGHEANGLTRGFASPLHSGFAFIEKGRLMRLRAMQEGCHVAVATDQNGNSWKLWTPGSLR
jgi:hypothetical protein